MVRQWSGALCQQRKHRQQNNNYNKCMVVNNEIVELNNAVLFARPLNVDAETTFTVSARELNDIHENISRPVVLLTLDSIKVSFTGGWVIEIFTMSEITTLFSFLDYQAKCRRVLASCQPDEAHSVLLNTDRHLVVACENESRTFLVMLISGMLNPQKHQMNNVFSFLRNTENYWISHFLLSQLLNENKEINTHKIYNACKIYGVSESYFRKLCRHAFTRGPKKQLRLWRAAYSVLQLIEQDNSVATIAGNNGYASSSHFSSEIKSLFGITPRQFKKLEVFLYE